jgi:hypothetical protein
MPRAPHTVPRNGPPQYDSEPLAAVKVLAVLKRAEQEIPISNFELSSRRETRFFKLVNSKFGNFEILSENSLKHIHENLTDKVVGPANLMPQDLMDTEKISGINSVKWIHHKRLFTYVNEALRLTGSDLRLMTGLYSKHCVYPERKRYPPGAIYSRADYERKTSGHKISDATIICPILFYPSHYWNPHDQSRNARLGGLSLDHGNNLSCISRLHFFMNKYETLYGLCISDKEVVIARRTRSTPERFREWGSIRLSEPFSFHTSGLKNGKLAIWLLCHRYLTGKDWYLPHVSRSDTEIERALRELMTASRLLPGQQKRCQQLLAKYPKSKDEVEELVGLAAAYIDTSREYFSDDGAEEDSDMDTNSE